MPKDLIFPRFTCYNVLGHLQKASQCALFSVVGNGLQKQVMIWRSSCNCNFEKWLSLARELFSCSFLFCWTNYITTDRKMEHLKRRKKYVIYLTISFSRLKCLILHLPLPKTFESYHQILDGSLHTRYTHRELCQHVFFR